MKLGIDIFCASQAATSISSCLTMDDPSSSSSSSSTIHLGRAIDRHNPIIRDPRRVGGGSCSRNLPYVPSCSSQPPIDPKPLSSHSSQHQKHQSKNGTALVIAADHSSKPSYNQKSHMSNTTNVTKKKKKKKVKFNSSSSNTGPLKPNHDQLEKKKIFGSSSSTGSMIKPASSSAGDHSSDLRGSSGSRKSWSCSSVKGASASDFMSPPAGSSRYLLSDRPATAANYFNFISDDYLDPHDLLKLLLPAPPVVELENDQPPTTSNPPSCGRRPNNINDDDDDDTSNNNSKASQKHDHEEVVVLRVSLHCRGCERKMRKHISRMEGVSSFNIDFAAKKVTVVGNVTPLGVLASISKVKNAQLWSPAAATTVLPSFTHHSTNSSEIS